ncbi:hypothetical protein ABZ234_07920 [Nocardiopsis sp. NPDC006198]|uniref:hypothetical protein n=1 Tax=Nocardiopsis sp. NPDC006198 TaxID=3154472 RepID=UPI0033B02C52
MKEIAFYPGVKEHDFPHLPQEYKIPLVNAIEGIRKGKISGSPLERELGDYGCKKLYLSTPEESNQQEQNKASGLPVNQGVDFAGGYRLVYREAKVRGKEAIVLVSVGPRKGSEVYRAAMSRLKAQANAAWEATKKTQPTNSRISPSPPTTQTRAAHRPQPKSAGGRGL